MMVLTIITLLISFLLQGIMSNLLNYNINNPSWFITVYTLITLLILAPYFENTKKRILIIIIVGLLIDMVYTNTGIISIFTFIATYYFSKLFHFFFPYNLLTINISNLICIFIYNILTFILLFILNYDRYSFMTLLKALSHSILMTIIFTSIMYTLIETITNKFELKEIK